MLQSSRPHPGWTICSRTHLTQQITALVAVIYYDERIQNKIMNGKEHVGLSWQKPTKGCHLGPGPGMGSWKYPSFLPKMFWCANPSSTHWWSYWELATASQLSHLISWASVVYVFRKHLSNHCRASLTDLVQVLCLVFSACSGQSLAWALKIERPTRSSHHS